jgi:hypothetical protein
MRIEAGDDHELFARDAELEEDRLHGGDAATWSPSARRPRRADANLSTQPARTQNEEGQLRDIRGESGVTSLNALGRIGSSGRIRT